MSARGRRRIRTRWPPSSPKTVSCCRTAALRFGREAIRSAYRGQGGPLWLKDVDYEIEGDLAYVVGVYGHVSDAPPTGKFVLTLRRSDGRWLIAADIDNSIRASAGR
jgi:hypothetical protein